MLVITVTSCPPALRGDLTLWLQEIDVGVYVGNVSARVREQLWQRVTENLSDGRATMVFSTNNEQKMDFRIHNSHWQPVNFDGLRLIMRPTKESESVQQNFKPGFSLAAQRQKARKFKGKTGNDDATTADTTMDYADQLSTEPKRKDDVYVVIDVETSGLHPLRNEIIEFGALKVMPGGETIFFSKLVKTNAPIQESITLITGITNQHLMDEGLELMDALIQFLDFVGDHTIVAHNARFDYQFIRQACKRCMLPAFTNYYIDTLGLAKRVIPGRSSYKLGDLAKLLGIKIDTKHRALEDCLTTNAIYERLLALEAEASSMQET